LKKVWDAQTQAGKERTSMSSTSSTSNEATKAGISFGCALAMVISYVNWHSAIWAIVHGVFGWLYVIYYLVRYTWL
jgi:hypothetical protein